jgi:Ca2+-binding RTX toxin-like protein
MVPLTSCAGAAGKTGDKIMYWTRDWMSGRSVLQGAESGENMNGTSGSETIYGNGGSDFINAGGGSDIVYGGTGSDVLKGGGGADYLNGGTDNDLLVGGTGRDTLTGGTGNDTFQYLTAGDSWANTASADHITDFRTGDHLDVTDYVMNTTSFGASYRVDSIESAQYWGNMGASQNGWGSAIFNSTNGRDVYAVMDLDGDRYMETAVVLDNLPNADAQFLGATHWIFS